MQLHRAKADIEARAARLVFVGNGNRHFAGAFRDELGLDEPVYVDTQRAAYAALEMKRPLLALLRPATVRRALDAWRQGHRQKRVQGDAFQLGGVLAVRPGGEVAYAHRSSFPGDHPPVEEILAAL